MKIRQANINDAEHIALLGRVTFTETFGHLFRDRQDLVDYYDRTFSVDKIEDSISKPNNVFWLATVDRLPVGYAKLKIHSLSSFIPSDSTCQLQKIYVLKDFLSKRIGQELQNRLLQRAKEENRKNIWLSVLNTNERAINFYYKNGFKKIGEEGFQIGKEDFEFLVLGKTLET